MRKSFARHALLCALPVAAALLWSAQAEAVEPINYRVLHTFCKATSCADGTLAMGVSMDADGDLFGVTAAGARFGGGALYELLPKHDGERYFKHVLKAFCDPDYCAGSGEPESAPILDVSGNLYGTTTGARQNQCGAVYMKSAERQLHVLHIFQGIDGCQPTQGSLVYQGSASGQAYDGVSPLYGVTNIGGTNKGGVVYELTPPQPGRKKWRERAIYSFCSISDCADGLQPEGNLVMDASGDLFGGTSDGLIFELSPNGSGGFDYQSLHISSTNENYVGFALASDGVTLYGFAASGGAVGGGTLFSLAPGTCRACGARQTIYQYTLLHTFCSGGGSCTDGHTPTAIVLDQQGDVFGVTKSGGANPSPPNVLTNGAGTVFEYTQAGSFQTLYNFCAQASCVDGGTPIGGLLLNNGALYGTTGDGGSNAHLITGAGVVFELTLP